MIASPLAEVPRPAPLPEPYVVRRRFRETHDTWTLELEPRAAGVAELAPGQFTMLYAFGVGEVPISVSALGRRGTIVQTIRDVGTVTHALCGLRRGGLLGVRGPFGRGWPAVPDGADAVVVAGGLGLAPLRPAVRALLDRARGSGRGLVLYGARTPEDVLYLGELDGWRTRGLATEVTVDAAGPGWTRSVGLVTKLVERADFDAGAAMALVCGPEVMMHFAARALRERGVPAGRIFVSLERSMQCGVGHCGHCQLGPTLVCRDGPVYAWGEVAPWLAIREL